ncbi:MAG: hypothetical protein K2F96_08950, partial [Muribaculaceae bacterium]|nr:hypothetical protein [Muribaculaceae bacterium]
MEINLTNELRNILTESRNIARQSRSRQIEPAHLLAALLQYDNTPNGCRQLVESLSGHQAAS